MKVRSVVNCGSLRAGQIYDVQQEIHDNGSSLVIVKGIPGIWNSNMFVVESFQPETYLAVSETFPVVGYPLICKKIDGCKTTGEVRILENVITSMVTAISYIGSNVCQVITSNNDLYIVQVLA